MKLAKHNKRALVLTIVLYIWLFLGLALTIIAAGYGSTDSWGIFTDIWWAIYVLPTLLASPFLSFFCKKSIRKTTIVFGIILGIPVLLGILTALGL